MSNDAQHPEHVKKTQRRNLMIVLGTAIILLWGLYALILAPKPEAQKKKDEVQFVSPLKEIHAESFILEKTQKALQDNQEKTENLQEQITQLNKEKVNPDVELLKLKLSELESRLDEQKNNNLLKMSQASIQEDKLNLSPSAEELEKQLPPRNPDNYVPAGTFVKAIMIGGADASAAVNAQGNPTPMVFRIIENGTLPNHKYSHLKDCVVTAAVVGDISSERGLIRLETLSCVKPNQSILDIPVQGTVFGAEGKNGVRGIPLWREGALLQRAFYAGALSGISNGISQDYITNSISPLGATSTVNPSQVFQYGAAKGVSNAMDKLADYNIKRAEQYHPVIQLSAGVDVDIVFLKGFMLDEKTDSDNKILDSNGRDEVIETSSRSIDGSEKLIGPTEFSGPSQAQHLSLSPQEIQQLKQHSAELGFNVKEKS